MLLLGLLGLAALVIDVGLARLTQAQMQCAVDAAALEGLRSGRQAASDLVARAFDDDLDLATEDDRLGAGPLLEFDDGLAGELHASRTLQRAAPGWKPTRSDGTVGLELNLGNATHGDLVAGTYSARTDLDGDGVLETRARHVEDDDYERDDFTAADAASATGAPAFLVRLRRTPDLYGLDRQPGVSAGGPALPFLFGLGTAIQADPAAPGGYQPRRDGLTVRATAIAEGQPVLAVGPRTPSRAGLASFGATAADWMALPDPFALTDAPFFEVPPGGGLLALGDTLSTTTPALALDTFDVYVPIVEVGASPARVVGFALARFDAVAGTHGKASRAVASGNATAVLARPTPAAPGLLGNAFLRSDDALLAPALVR